VRDTFIRTLTALAETRPDLMLITADLGFGVLNDWILRFPKQFLNAGVAEQNMTGLAAGMALEGRTVFTYSLGSFPTVRCLEQIRNDVCYHHANVKIVTVGGGMSYGPVGASHHATEDLAIMRSLPNMVVVSPGDLWETAEATRALVGISGPSYLRLDKSAAAPTHVSGERFHLGRIRVIRQGSDVTLAATGGILGEALRAADLLALDGVTCRVLSVHTIKPLDHAALVAAALETGGIVTMEEHSLDGGMGGAVAESLMDAGAAPGFFLRFGLRQFSSIVGSQSYLRKAYGMDAGAVADAVAARLRSSGVPAGAEAEAACAF
jgi:transketolase